MFFLFKQKTAYVLLISGWRSDRCSSDLSAVVNNSTDQEVTLGVRLNPFAGTREPITQEQQGRVLRNMARTEIELGDRDAAARAIDRGLALAGSDGDTTARAQFLGISATLAQRRGHVERARRLIDRALADVDIDTSTLA